MARPLGNPREMSNFHQFFLMFFYVYLGALIIILLIVREAIIKVLPPYTTK